MKKIVKQFNSVKELLDYAEKLFASNKNFTTTSIGKIWQVTYHGKEIK